MKVWLLHDESHGEVSVYAEDTDISKVPYVVAELSYLDGGYEDERDDFLADLVAISARGHGEASIEERFWVELVQVG